MKAHHTIILCSFILFICLAPNIENIYLGLCDVVIFNYNTNPPTTTGRVCNLVQARYCGFVCYRGVPNQQITNATRDCIIARCEENRPIVAIG